MRLERPQITTYQDALSYFRDMLSFRKNTEAGFTVVAACESLRKVSPTLVTLILQGKRKITLDRVEELAKLLKLNASEKQYFRFWFEPETKVVASTASAKNRKTVSTHILMDWLNVYVKDSFQIIEIQKNPEKIYQQLGHIANRKRIDKSIQFLLREGHLRKTLSNEIVVETNLAVADPQVPSQKIRNFHKAALNIAKTAIDQFPANQRYANTLIVPMNEENYVELTALIQEFAKKLQDFAADTTVQGERLYQVIINVSPTGGKFE